MIDKHDLHHEFPEYYDRIHELKTNNTHFARLFDPLASLATALKEGRDVRGARAVLLAQSGETIHVRVTLFPIRDQDKVVGGVSIFHLETTAPRAS